MEITEVRIKLVTDLDDRLRAFCSITFDSQFVVRDLKIIEGQRGHFVAMPSRKLMEKCGRCSAKNEVRAKYCSNCGSRLPESRIQRNDGGKQRMFADIAHPINAHCRDRIENAVLLAFDEERELAMKPGYICRYDDYDDPAPRSVSSGHGDHDR